MKSIIHVDYLLHSRKWRIAKTFFHSKPEISRIIYWTSKWDKSALYFVLLSNWWLVGNPVNESFSTQHSSIYGYIVRSWMNSVFLTSLQPFQFSRLFDAYIEVGIWVYKDYFYFNIAFPCFLCNFSKSVCRRTFATLKRRKWRR